MTGDKRSAGELCVRQQCMAVSLTPIDVPNRLNVKSGKKLLAKPSKSPSSTISSPPKAAIASSPKKDDVHRRRNLNDILRRRSGDATAPSIAPPLQDVALDINSKGAEEIAVDTRMADRVAELERALSLAREEQNALREALEESKRQREEDRGTSGRVYREHSHSPDSTREDLQRGATSDGGSHDEDLDRWSDSRSSRKSLDTANRRPSSSHSHDDLLRQNHDLRYKLAHLQDRLVSQDAAYRANLEHTRSHGQSDLNELRTRLHATEKESHERLQQLLSLKSSISSLTRADAQVTDSELSDAFDVLANRIREWVISNFRKTRLDVGHLPAETVRALRAVTPAYESIESTDRLALYQAIVSNEAMQIFDEPIALGLPHTGSFGALRVFAESMENASAEYREWRRATYRLIEGNKESLTMLQRNKSEVLHRIGASISRLLCTLTSVELSSNAMSALMGILDTAADMQRTFALQKARYQVHFFRNPGSERHMAFDERGMEPVNDLDNMMDHDEDSRSTERQFMFCVFPCLEKSGDEWGNNVQVINVLRKARVCCSSD